MKRYKVRLKMKSPIHIGFRESDPEVSEITASSDTIFSGIVNTYALLYGKEETDKLIDKFMNSDEDIPFKVSSLFPYIKDEYFLPKPINYKFDTDNEKVDIKKISKAKYISEKVISKDLKDIKINHGFVSEEELKSAPYKIIKRPRVSIDRVTSATHIYYMRIVRYSENAGLWFFLDSNDEFDERIKAAIRLLGDEGLGGERSIGMGLFEPTFEELQEQAILTANNNGKYLLLSSLIPRNQEECNALSAYELYEKTGFIYPTFGADKKHEIYTMVKEGAILSKPVLGKLVDGTPSDFKDHRIIKYGLAYIVPFD